MYEMYAKAVLAGTRDINSLKGVMRQKVEEALAKLKAEQEV